MMRFQKRGRALVATVAMTGAAACTDAPTEPHGALSAASISRNTPAPPTPVVDVTLPGGTISLWPFTGADLSGVPSDPINLIFTGEADPLSIRAALLGLNGNRAAFGFPPVAPFDCTWSDAFGDAQLGYANAEGWVGSAIQLQCGAYGPIRFHIRMFPAGHNTIANAHFEVLIPNTTEHQVLSWELAKQLVVVDFLRSGLLDVTTPLLPTPVIHPAPGFREIPAIIYNGLPAALTAVIGGPTGPVSAPVPIGTNGRAAILNLNARAPIVDGTAVDDFTVQFNQIIPKPFCNSGTDYVLVQGPVEFSNRVSVNQSLYHMIQSARARLTLTAVNPLNGTPLGEPYEAIIGNWHESTLGPGGSAVKAIVERRELPAAAGHVSLFSILTTSPGGMAHFDRNERC